MTNDDNIIPGLSDAESIIAMRRRHLELGLRLQRLAIIALEEWEQKVKAGKPLDVSVEDARTLLATGKELERSGLGKKEPDDDDPTIPWPKKPH